MASSEGPAAVGKGEVGVERESSRRGGDRAISAKAMGVRRIRQRCRNDVVAMLGRDSAGAHWSRTQMATRKKADCDETQKKCAAERCVRAGCRGRRRCGTAERNGAR